MLRKLLDYQLSLTRKGGPLHAVKPLVTAADTFLYEAAIETKGAPHVRDAIDVKRWMLLVVIALLPCLLFAIWNTGLQSYVYSSGDYKLMEEFQAASMSVGDYFAFAGKEQRYLSILGIGLGAVLPILLISYVVGGLCEAFFAILRNHEISEGFLVTGILYALILPPTISYWMVAVGVAAGVILGKELFGGSGMNIVNPALTCRAFLFFTFPSRMSGDVWVGTNPTTVRQSLVKMNRDADAAGADGFTQATMLSQFNISHDIKKIHVDAIASNDLGDQVRSWDALQTQFAKWTARGSEQATLGQLSQEQLHGFVTSPLAEGGLGLSSSFYEDASRFASLNYGMGNYNDWGFFLGNKLGCIGETCGLAIVLGALFLLYVGVASWRTMAGMLLGALLTAGCFQLLSALGSDGGAWNPAQFGFPAYKHLLLGGMLFGLVFMATDPVSSPDMPLAKWIYGLFCGMIAIIIRVINPAYPEGVMLAILVGNVFAPLFDRYAAHFYRNRRRSRGRARTTVPA